MFVVELQPSIDHKDTFDKDWEKGIQTSTYNILCDAGCIPHFAYQSLLKYEKKDRLATG